MIVEDEKEDSEMRQQPDSSSQFHSESNEISRNDHWALLNKPMSSEDNEEEESTDLRENLDPLISVEPRHEDWTCLWRFW